MKKLKFLLIFIIACTLAKVSSSQFYMSSSGSVSIGSTSAAVTPFQSFVNTMFCQNSSGVTSYAPLINAAVGTGTSVSSASAPDYTWYNDGTTGIFHPSANTIGFSVSGNERFLVSYERNILWNSWTNVIINQDSGDCCGTPVIYPQNSWYLQLGNGTHFLGDCYISHELYKTAPSLYSDINIKQNINYNIDSTLIKLEQLKPASFNYKPSFFSDAPAAWAKKYSCRQYGFIAQDLIKVFPEMVQKDSASNLLSVNYIAIIPLLVKGMQIQQAQLENLQKQLDSCCNLNQSRSQHKAQKPNPSDSTNDGTSTSSIDPSLSGRAKLYQNAPNPFNTSTTVTCFIPEQSNSASLLILDMTGALKTTIPIDGKDNQSIIINGGQLHAGMYYYTLLVDGKEIDTKKMILTQ